MKTITIESNEDNNFNVRQGDRYAEGLTFEEMLGVVAHIAKPEYVPYDNWLLTKEQHEEKERRWEQIRNEVLIDNETNITE